MEATLGENAVKIIDMTTKDLKYYINLVNESVAGFERTDPNFERTSTVGKTHHMLQRNSLWKEESVDVSNSNSILF